LNLYDVHAPYSPATDSILARVRSWHDLVQNVGAMAAMPHIGCHEYLQPGFRLPDWQRRALLERYHRAIELMDAKVGAFHAGATRAGLLSDTMLVVASDHGEAFGEHDLYLHDASVYDIHLRVPLWVQHPALSPAAVEDVVSMAGVASMLRAAALDRPLRGTLLDAEYRSRHPIALAQHFHYPHAPGMAPQYRSNPTAAIVGRHKVIVRDDRVDYFDLAADGGEQASAACCAADFAALCREQRVAAPQIAAALAHLLPSRRGLEMQRCA
jgi:arylsulfatase A-like enzyme